MSINLIERFSGVHVLCVGDVMLDRFVDGTVQRISPESPVPVLSVRSTNVFAGGAANVARNIAAIGGKCCVVGAIGDDEAGGMLLNLLASTEGISADLVRITDRPTIEKTRFVAHGQHMLRVDLEIGAPVSPEAEQRLLEIVEAQLDLHQVLVLSDYAKGVLTDRVIAGAIAAAHKRNIAVIVDPKSNDLTRYNGATIVTPNSREAMAATGIDPMEDRGSEAAGRYILDQTTVNAVLITRADKGMSLIERQGEPFHIAATAHEVADVVGAGDTVIATLALAIGGGAPTREAARIANTAAGLVVAKRGTATVTQFELRAALQQQRRPDVVSYSTKLLSRDQVCDQVNLWRSNGLSVGFTNGCFDVLHAGHVGILSFSRSNCDRLIVGINTDTSVRRLKGPNRPINMQDDRALLIAALSVVDAVVLFDEDTPVELIASIRPDVLVKGSDYAVEQIVGADIVLSAGGRVLRFDLVHGRSTTQTLAKLSMGVMQ